MSQQPTDLSTTPDSFPKGAQPELPPDPGSPRRNLVLWALIAVLFGLVIYEQQSSSIGSQAAQPGAPVAVDPNALVETDNEQMVSGITRLMIKVGHAFKQADPSAPIGNFVDALDQQAQTDTDKLRLVIATAELKDDQAALKRLDTFEAISRTDTTTETDTPEVREDAKRDAAAMVLLKKDAATLRAIYEGKKADLTDQQRTELVARHKKLGEIALTFKDGQTPARTALLAGGAQLMALIFVVGFAVVGAFVLGFLLFPFMIVMFATRRLRTHFVPPSPGGSIFLETFVVFLGGFLLLKLVSGAIVASNPGERWPVYAAMAGQWLLVPIVFWPRVRGMSASAWSSAVGLHAGRGVGREIIAGIVGYISGLPLLALAALVTMVLIFVREFFVGKDAAPNNPIADYLSQADLPLQLLLAGAAVAWAPFVEELVFRGGIYRHLRGRVPVVVAAVVSALIFGFMHGYNPILLLPVITLGFNFALMREWRGSIIASMTAHAIHNGFVIVAMIVGINLLG